MGQNFRIQFNPISPNDRDWFRRTKGLVSSQGRDQTVRSIRPFKPALLQCRPVRCPAYSVPINKIQNYTDGGSPTHRRWLANPPTVAPATGAAAADSGVSKFLCRHLPRRLKLLPLHVAWQRPAPLLQEAKAASSAARCRWRRQKIATC